MADVFRQPLVAPRPRKRAADQSFRVPNLLLTTLVVVAAAPFFGRTGDNPIVRKAQAQPALTATGRPPNTIIPAFPVSRPDGVEHRLQRKKYVQPALTATGRPPDTIIPAFPTSRPDTQTYPSARRSAQQAPQPPNLLLSTLAVAAPPELPVGRQTDWPNPVVRKHLLRTTIARSSYDPPAPVVPPEPFPVGRQLDWPNPSKRRTLGGIEFEHASYQEIPDFLLTSLRHDWPNPVVRRSAQQPHPLPNLLSSTLFVTPLPPFKQTDWQNPSKAHPRTQADSAGNLLLTTLYVAPQPFPPGRMQDFPNPVRAKYTQIRYEFSGTPVPNEIPPPIVPPEPVPSGYVGGGGGGGGGGEWYKETRKRPTVYDRLHQDIKEVVIDPKFIRDVYEELMASDEAAPALEKAVRVPKAPSGADDWDAMARDAEQVRALMLQAQAEQKRREIAEDDADWEWF